MSNAADQVIELIFGRWRSQTLSAGAELGIFDRLDRGMPKTSDRLAGELGLDPLLPYRLLRAQTAISLLTEDSSKGFVLTEAGDLLRTAHPQSLNPMVRLEEGPHSGSICRRWFERASRTPSYANSAEWPSTTRWSTRTTPGGSSRP
jgi:Dimerisation domain